MTARVVFTAGFSRRYTGGVREFTVEAKNLRGVIKAMDQLYPGLGHHLEEETTVAIDGATPRDRLFPAAPPGLRGLLHPQARRRDSSVPKLWLMGRHPPSHPSPQGGNPYYSAKR